MTQTKQEMKCKPEMVMHPFRKFPEGNPNPPDGAWGYGNSLIQKAQITGANYKRKLQAQTGFYLCWLARFGRQESGIVGKGDGAHNTFRNSN